MSCSGQMTIIPCAVDAGQRGSDYYFLVVEHRFYCDLPEW